MWITFQKKESDAKQSDRSELHHLWITFLVLIYITLNYEIHSVCHSEGVERPKNLNKINGRDSSLSLSTGEASPEWNEGSEILRTGVLRMTAGAVRFFASPFANHSGLALLGSPE